MAHGWDGVLGGDIWDWASAALSTRDRDKLPLPACAPWPTPGPPEDGAAAPGPGPCQQQDHHQTRRHWTPGRPRGSRPADWAQRRRPLPPPSPEHRPWATQTRTLCTLTGHRRLRCEPSHHRCLRETRITPALTHPDLGGQAGYPAGAAVPPQGRGVLTEHSHPQASRGARAQAEVSSRAQVALTLGQGRIKGLGGQEGMVGRVKTPKPKPGRGDREGVSQAQRHPGPRTPLSTPSDWPVERLPRAQQHPGLDKPPRQAHSWAAVRPPRPDSGGHPLSSWALILKGGSGQNRSCPLPCRGKGACPVPQRPQPPPCQSPTQSWEPPLALPHPALCMRPRPAQQGRC